MLTAAEANAGTKKTRGQSIEEVLRPVSQGIHDAMSRGFFAITVQGKSVPSHLTGEFRATLEGLGYKVAYNGGDQREPADEWTVSW